MRRATYAVVAMPRPSETMKTMVSMDSVRATAAGPSRPRRATKKMSTMPNSDSMNISSTMGTASRAIARGMGPSVKSCWVPLSDSRTEPQKESARAIATG